MLDKLIFYSFALIFFLVPLFWTPLNFELFEYNKMMFTFVLTIIIVGAWLLKIVNRKSVPSKVEGSLLLNRTPLDIPLLLFLGAHILSTIFSIDPHTSIWGYYSRSNGGFLSLLSYLLLYWAFVSNINKEQVFKLLKVALFSGLIISIWGILEHFGVSPSCVLLRGEFNANCWVQDVQARVFATLGQPNWMAAFLGMLIFPAMYFFLTAATKKLRISYLLSLISLYMAFTFTFSRGAFLGFLAGLGVFTILSFWRPQADRISELVRFYRSTSFRSRMTLIVGSFILVNLLFGSALTRFNLSQLLPQHTSEVESWFNPVDTSEVNLTSTQLESGGTESGQIRLIVWQGAIEIFKHYPLFGSGVETFAYAYYQFRPVAHNLVSEWDFLYNKAHNEFLNYLATTGIVGLGSYSIIIITFITIILRKQRKNLLALALLASYISYLVQNFFGFSVVIVALFFYLFPALAFVAVDSTKPMRLPLIPFGRLSQVVIILITCYLLFVIFKIWYADTFFSLGQNSSDNGNPGASYNYLTKAVALNPGEPLFRSELAYAAAASASLITFDATTSAQLKAIAIEETNRVLTTSPKNVSFWRTAIRTYFELSSIDDSFLQKTLYTVDKTISLAPTDAKLYYNKAVILGTVNRNDEAITSLQKAIELKPNYREAIIALGLFYFDTDQKEKAVETMYKVLQLIPGDPEALEKLNEWGREGIATSSGNLSF